MIDFNSQVPKTLAENLAYRIDLRKRAAGDLKFQRAMRSACRHDFLFFLNAWAWLYEPRKRFNEFGQVLPKRIPFITWPHQDTAIAKIIEQIGSGDIGIEKSRGEGASWIGVLLALHNWLFLDDVTIGMCSSTEEKADKPGDRGSLFGKLDWELTTLPTWMTGVKDVDWFRNQGEHTLRLPKRNNLIVAHAATAGTGRGHRYYWFMLDELGEWRPKDGESVLASLQHATDSRLIPSTPAGIDGPYYEIMHEPSNMLKINLNWEDNPSKNRGLYRFEKGRPVAVDPVGNPLPDKYNPPDKEILTLFSLLRKRGFKLEGRLRSPWYDRECARPNATPQKIAQELDRDYGGTMHRVYQHDFFDKAEAAVRPPMVRGMLSYHQETLEPEFDRGSDAPMLLWCNLDQQLKPPPRPYVVGCDIATGLGGSYSSNSAIVVLDLVTLEQVFEYAVNTMPPSEFAELSIAVSKWFFDAYLSWENNGPGGSAFTKRVLDKHYPNFYYKTEILKGGARKKTNVAGWTTTNDSKNAMFHEVGRGVRLGDVKPRSEMLVKEFGQYVYLGGSIEHVLSRSTQDDASKGKAHGDRVIAFAVALMAARDRPMMSKAVDDYLATRPPPGTMAARLRAHDDSKREDPYQWDDRNNSDLAHGHGLLPRV